MFTVDQIGQLPRSLEQPPNDAQSDPEPAVPSLPGPDPGVFHHEPLPWADPQETTPEEPTA